MSNLIKNEQSGRSMVEMLGVLAIIGVLSVGGISGYSKAMAKFKLTKAQDQLSMLLMNIRTAYATSPSYAGLTTANAVAYNLTPSDMVAGATLHNAFGGDVFVNSDAGNSNLRFAIVFNGLGPETCMSLASSDWGSEGLVGISITAAQLAAPTFAATYTPGGAGNNALPVTLPVAAGACSSPTATNSIEWIYY